MFVFRDPCRVCLWFGSPSLNHALRNRFLKHDWVLQLNSQQEQLAEWMGISTQEHKTSLKLRYILSGQKQALKTTSRSKLKFIPCHTANAITLLRCTQASDKGSGTNIGSALKHRTAKINAPHSPYQRYFTEQAVL